MKFAFTPEHLAKTITEPSSVKSSVKTPVKILQLLKEKSDQSLAELAALMGKSVRTIERASTKLVKAGELRRIGPDKVGTGKLGESQKDEGKSMKKEVIFYLLKYLKTNKKP